MNVGKMFRAPLWVLGLVMVALLSACGNAGSDTPAAVMVDPETRVVNFFNTFSEAINDPTISEAATQETRIEELLTFIVPADRDEARAELQGIVTDMGGTNMGQMVGDENLDIRMQVTFNLTETLLVSETDDQAVVEMVDGNVSMQVVGEDIDELGEMSGMLNQELALSDFFGPNQADRQINLQEIDGVWYLENPFR